MALIMIIMIIIKSTDHTKACLCVFKNVYSFYEDFHLTIINKYLFSILHSSLSETISSLNVCLILCYNTKFWVWFSFYNYAVLGLLFRLFVCLLLYAGRLLNIHWRRVPWENTIYLYLCPIEYTNNRIVVCLA